MLVAVLTGEVRQACHLSGKIGVADDAALAGLARLIEPGSLLEATPECLVVAHADGRIVFANHHMEALTGLSVKVLVGTPVELLLVSDFRNQQVGTRVETVCIGHEGREIHRRGACRLDR